MVSRNYYDVTLNHEIDVGDGYAYWMTVEYSFDECKELDINYVELTITDARVSKVRKIGEDGDEPCALSEAQRIYERWADDHEDEIYDELWSKK